MGDSASGSGASRARRETVGDGVKEEPVGALARAERRNMNALRQREARAAPASAPATKATTETTTDIAAGDHETVWQEEMEDGEEETGGGSSRAPLFRRLCPR